MHQNELFLKIKDEGLKGIDKGKDSERVKKVTYKEYQVNKVFLFPPSSDDYIGKDHIARLIDYIVERIDIGGIEKTYKGGGASAYHPRMMLKVWILGIAYKIYSSRALAQAIRENIAFIWISGGNRPDFRTLNNFRLRLEEDVKKVFKEVVIYGKKLGVIKGGEIFIDHTKIEANANKNKMVWKKQVERQMEKIDEEIESLFKYINELNIEEDKKYGERGIEGEVELDIEKLEKMVEVINEKMREKEIEKEEGKEMKGKLRRAKELIERKEGYKEKEEILGGRSSYSKTDPDATAMRQKDGITTKPSYNEGIAVENGFVINYEIGQNAGDNVNFKEIVEGVIENLGKAPGLIHTDGAYGNEENMLYLKEKGIGNYLKYNSYNNEKKGKRGRGKIRKEDFKYDKERDCYICVEGKELKLKMEKENILPSGYRQRMKEYQAEEGDCKGCALKRYCTSGKARSITVLPVYEELKEEARANLCSEKGKELRRQRGYQVESIFGERKMNGKLRRYFLRGLKKVYIESGLYYISVNIKKIYKYLKELYSISGFNGEGKAFIPLGIK